MTIYCGVDFHARQQFIKWCDTTDGEIHQQQLWHRSPDEVRKFYAQFTGQVIVGLEASGYSQWFETMLHELGHQVWIGDAIEIRRRARSRQKTDRRDAELLLDLLLKDEFPRIHRLSLESLEVLRRLRYRHRLVQMRTKVQNALQAIALSAGVSLKSKLRTKKGQALLRELWLSPAHTQQREEWLSLIAELNTRIERLEKELEPLANADERVRRVRTHPGIGLLTGLAPGPYALASQPLSQQPQSNSLCWPRTDGVFQWGETTFQWYQQSRITAAAFLLVEAGNSAASNDEHLKQIYHRILHRRDRARAKVAVARHVLIHAYIMLRDEIDYAEFLRRGVTVRSARTVHRPQVPARLIERPASEPPPQG